jgi:hypothetical protein
MPLIGCGSFFKLQVRRRGFRAALFAGPLLFAAVSGERSAASADKQACVAAHEAAQKLRQGGKLREAREKLVSCAQDACPAMVRADCGPWLREVENGLPTIVIAARNADGSDAADVKVTIDRSTVLAKLDGTAVPIDPGEHELRFERPPSPSILQTVVAREGEKGRRIEVRFAAPEAAPPQPRTRSALPYVFLGVGGVALGTSLYLTLHAKSERDSLPCSPHCSNDEVAPIQTELREADVALGLGVVFAGIATYLLLSSPSSPPASAAPTSLPSFRTDPSSGSFGAAPLPKLSAFDVRCGRDEPSRQLNAN